MADGPPPAATESSKPVPPAESLIVLSDVHLGRELQFRRPARGTAQSRTDRDLVRLCEHYVRTPPVGQRWRLVIAGDFIDFIGMTVRTDGEALETEPSAEEKRHGLGSASDHARAKLRRVAECHSDVFRALARFVAAGHAITLVHGNHDVELYWQDVQSDFRALLVAHLEPSQAHLIAASVEFRPWFFYMNGVAYIEHGHQYDPFCSSEHIMAPLSPLDPRRITQSFCDVFIRTIVRPTPGLREHGHERMGVADYFAFGARLGISGCWRLAHRFASAVVELFRLRRQYLTEAATRLRDEHDRRVRLLAEASRIGLDRLHALAALQAQPVTRSIRGILASVLLDRIALTLLGSILMVAVALVGLHNGHALWGLLGVLGAWSLAHRELASYRQIDSAEAMKERAGHLAKLFPAAFVVMGHTHAPVKQPILSAQATYVNLGAWADDENDDGEVEHSAPRTHLVIRTDGGGRPVGEFLAWDDLAPKRFASPAVLPSLVPPASS